jgi:hypothetical protein
MSRIVTPPTAQPTGTLPIPHDKIAMRAYEKWLKRGRRHGNDMQDWIEAEVELREEMRRSNLTGTTMRH